MSTASLPKRGWTRRPVVVTLGALVVLGALLLVATSASARPGHHRPGTQSTFRPPGFGTGPGTAPSNGKPGAYVQDYGTGGGAPHTGPAPSPTVKATRQLTVDGCDHAYGTVNQCVPAVFPAGVTDRCAWLRAHNFGPLRVNGPDPLRLNLDTNHDHIACGPGDR